MNRLLNHFRASLLFIGLVLGGLCLCHSHAAAAEAYPYADMPCVWAPYATEGVQANWCNDYDWGTTAGSDAQASTISPYGYVYRNCTDYVAWKLDTRGIPPAQYKGLGNAKEWGVRAPSHALDVDGVPAVGAIAVRTTGFYGHLAYVEEVYGDGRIKVSQYNRHATGGYSEDVGTPGAFGFGSFIHFEALAPQSVSEEVATPEPVVEPQEVEKPGITPVELLPEPAVAVSVAMPEPEPAEEVVAEPLVELASVVIETPAATEEPEPPAVAVPEPLPVASVPEPVLAAQAASPPPVVRVPEVTPPPQAPLPVPKPVRAPATIRPVATHTLSFRSYWPIACFVGLVGVHHWLRHRRPG